MKAVPDVRILDITQSGHYENYLHRCLVGPPSKRYKKRIAYIEEAIPKGFCKKLLLFKETVVGTIEYSPPEVSYYPIIGDNLIVMNCIWVLRKAKGYNFGRMLIADLIESKREAHGISTIALTGHWSPWFKKEQFERLGFNSLNSVRVTHQTKRKETPFEIHLMWMPMKRDARPPSWHRQKLLEGITACTAHPLYHPQSYQPKQIFKKCSDD
ncbi:MAG: hypothetical protein ACFE89_04000 [Candidatus Hodarchaeota archaeon]